MGPVDERRNVDELLVELGDKIAVGMPILEVETDKIANQVEAADAGALRRKLAGEGERLPVKALLGVMAEDDVSERTSTPISAPGSYPRPKRQMKRKDRSINTLTSVISVFDIRAVDRARGRLLCSYTDSEATRATGCSISMQYPKSYQSSPGISLDMVRHRYGCQETQSNRSRGSALNSWTLSASSERTS